MPASARGDIMGQLIVSAMVTLDGVMQAPGGPEEDTEGGFKHGGWQMPLLDEESLNLITRDIGRMDALLLGRKTYDIFAAYWPKATTGKILFGEGTLAAGLRLTSSQAFPKGAIHLAYERAGKPKHGLSVKG